MNPDAQNVDKSEGIFVKFLPEIEEKRGDLVAWKDDQGTWEEKPYPNEHACRLESPDKYIRIRRENDKFGKGIHALWGIQEGAKPVELQAIRFSLEKFTAAEARAWVKTHDYKCTAFEPATGGKDGGEEGESFSCEDESKETLPIAEENPPAQDATKDESPSGDADVIKDILVCLAELKADLSALKEMVKPEPIPDDPKEDSGDKPPELVIERDDLTAPNAKAAIIGAIREVVGERIQSDIDRMKGKVK